MVRSPSDTAEQARERGNGGTYLLRGRTDVTLPPQATALLVIDPVNDFLSEGGAGWPMTKATVKMNDVIGNLKRAIDGARERGVPVLYAPMAYTEEDYRDHDLHRRSGINRIMFENRMFLAGSWGADFHPDLRPREDETVLRPHKGTDVMETDLPDHLRRLGTTHLVIAGMTANLCCESTGRRATDAGFDVTFIRNAIGAESVPAYEASIHVNYPLIANAVLEVDEFLAAVDAAGAGPGKVEAGDEVYGSDHGKLGEVERVVEASPEAAAHLVVPRGVVFEKDTFVPLDAVVKRANGKVFLNVPKIVVGKMPWSEPPTLEGQREKQGPPGEDVGKLYGSRDPTTPVTREERPREA